MHWLRTPSMRPTNANNGIELGAGVKNRIYVATLDLWEYDIRTDILYEKGIACVSPVSRLSLTKLS